MATELHRHIAAEMRAEMARQGIHQGELARRLEIHQTAVSRKLSGKYEFTTRDIQAYAAALGVPVAQLLPQTDVAA